MAMNRTPVADWQKLSALYEAADALDPVALAEWLAKLRVQAHPLLPQLMQMLAARSQVQANDFLGTLPRLPPPPLPGAQARTIDWAEGSRIGPYRLVRPLGEGGMAEVWLAKRDDGAFERAVAIKLLFRHAGSSERDSFAQRFARERDILASLHHPNIAGLHDAGVTPGGQPWLALEYVEGEPLLAWCDAKRLGIEARVRLFRQVLLAVQHAHANLVIHRDLKPGNILVTAHGEVRLLDFGIAKLMEPEGGALDETELTRMAGRPMTVQYASPEQLLGKPLTTSCDVYSLGVLLYELLCGERPYELKMESFAQLEQAIVDIEPRAPSRRALSGVIAAARSTAPETLRKTLASDLDAIALHALAKVPTQRYASVEALRADLDRWLASEPVEARAPSTAYRIGKFVRRHTLSVSLGSAAVLALVAVATVAVLMGLQARDDSARAGAARDFMLGLFKRADQEKARGADITARELLETGRKDLLARLPTQPRLQAELLQGIGTIQRDMGEYVGADSTFADAARLYGRLGLPREAAMARSSQADVAVRMGDMKLAQTALQQVRSIPGWPAADPELNARIDEIRGWVAYAQGDAAQARDLFRQSHAHALKAFGPYHVKVIDALRGQAYAERQLRDFDEALQLLDQLEATAAKTGDLDPRVLPALARDRADVLQAAGHYGEAYAQVAAALPKCVSDFGPNHSECRELMFSKVGAMLRLGMVAQAAADLPALRAIADDRTSPALGADTLLLILKVESGAGTPADQAAAFERLRALVESDAGATFGPRFKARALLGLAEARLRAKDPADAERWVAKALAVQRPDSGSALAAMSAALARSLRGVALLERGQTAEALSNLRTAQDVVVKALGPDDPAARVLSLNTALALEWLGRPKDALEIVDQAEPVLRRSMGENAPTYLRVRELQNRLQRGLAPEPPVRRGAEGAVPHAGTGAKLPTIDFFS